MSYLVVAYALILGTLAVYAWRLRSQRQLLERLSRQGPIGSAPGIIESGSAEDR